MKKFIDQFTSRINGVIEYATDVMFESTQALQGPYPPNAIRGAISVDVRHEWTVDIRGPRRVAAESSQVGCACTGGHSQTAARGRTVAD